MLPTAQDYRGMDIHRNWFNSVINSNWYNTSVKKKTWESKVRLRQIS